MICNVYYISNLELTRRVVNWADAANFGVEAEIAEIRWHRRRNYNLEEHADGRHYCLWNGATSQESALKYLHTMVRVTDLDESLDFYCTKLGLKEVRRYDNDGGRYTLVFLAPLGQEECQLELTFNWDPEGYTGGRNFGHVAFEVDNIYTTCQVLMDNGVTINRPPRDGRMAFIRSPDDISIELLQKGGRLPVAEPWASMPNTGSW